MTEGKRGESQALMIVKQKKQKHKFPWTEWNWVLMGILTTLTIANGYFWWGSRKTRAVQEITTTEKVAWLLPAQEQARAKSGQIETPEVNARAALVMDIKTKQILFAKNKDELVYPASTTKIITALTAREFYTLNEDLLISGQDLSDGNPLALKVGEKIRVDTLLKALLIESNNQAATILANHYPGGNLNFVTMMNQKAIKLGLKNSYFTNPQGYDNAQQQATAFDLSIAAMELLRDQYLAEIVKQRALTVNDANGKIFQLNNTNQLLAKNNLGWTALGVKTGTTSLAKEVLISLIKKDETELLIVVFGAENRYNEVIKLANFSWDNFTWEKLELWQKLNQPLI